MKVKVKPETEFLTKMKTTHSVEWYRDSMRGHRWRIRARNGRIICAASEGYKRRASAVRSLGRLITAIHAFTVKFPIR